MNLSSFYEDTQRLDEEQAAKLLSALTNCEVSSTVAQDEDEEQWVQNRKLGIGGSDVGSICGVNKYSSARLTYLIKTGQYEQEFSDESKERMGWGHKLEPIVADEFQARTGKKVVISPATLRHKEHPWALANVDRFIVDEDGKPYGVLECKTADWRLNKDWESGEIPMSYIYQLTWYLWITGLEYGAFAALVGGNNFHYYEVYLNRELVEQEIFPKCERFWNYNIRKGIEPELTGNDADSDYIKDKLMDVEKDSEIDLANELEYNELANTIYEAKQQIKELNIIVKEAENKIKEKMATHELAYTLDRTIKWSPRQQTRVDTDRLRAEFPDVWDKCKKQIQFRVMTIK